MVARRLVRRGEVDRRAAEAASEAEADDRALALAKAAADLATQIGPTPSSLPPAPAAGPQIPLPGPPPTPALTPAPAAAAPAPVAAAPAPAAAPQPAAPPAAPPPVPMARPAAGAPAPPPVQSAAPPRTLTSRPPAPAAQVRPSTAPKAPGSGPKLGAPAAVPKQPPAAGRPAIPQPPATKPNLQGGAKVAPQKPMPASRPAPQAALPKVIPGRPPETKRGRRSSGNLNEEAKRVARELATKEVTLTSVMVMPREPDVAPPDAFPEVTQQIPMANLKMEETPLADARVREVRTPPASPVGVVPPDAGARDGAGHVSTDDMDAWPTQSLAGDDDSATEEKTRIGALAYTEVARMTGAQDLPRAPVVVTSGEAELRTSQAVRVVVWRGADGVRVAPAGTKVAAISIEAVLVALDPAADLAAWLRQS